jgi:hypothetical protein
MPWRHVGEWMYSSTILDLGTTWRWVELQLHSAMSSWHYRRNIQHDKNWEPYSKGTHTFFKYCPLLVMLVFWISSLTFVFLYFWHKSIVVKLISLHCQKHLLLYLINIQHINMLKNSSSGLALRSLLPSISKYLEDGGSSFLRNGTTCLAILNIYHI